MPTSVIDEVDGPRDLAVPRPRRRPAPHPPRSARPAHGALRARTVVLLQCPACLSTHVAQVLGDNGGVSYVCTACGHSWS